LLLLLLAASFPCSASAQQTEFLDSVVTEGLKSFQVPGLAVVVVRNDQVIYLKGVGVRKIGSSEPVTPDTIFALASVTKAFTATALGILVDEGKADWDDPVRKHLPWFRMADPLADRDVTLRDMLCHRTGLVRHDLLWYQAGWDVEETVRRMAFLEPRSSFRATFRYNNLGYLAAGLATASAAKLPWHEFVQKRIFDPLAMKNSVFTRSQAEKTGHAATPHTRRGKDMIETIPWYPDDQQIRASGSIKSCVRDLVPYLRLQLAGGTCGATRVISSRSLAETHRPQIVTPIESAHAQLAGTTQASYGLGWHILDYRGQLLLEHGGSNDGSRARVMLFPRSKLGLALLTNIDEADVLQAVGNIMADHLLELPKKEWQSYYLRHRRVGPSSSSLPTRVKGTKPSLELQAYAGTYEEGAYGTVRVTYDEGKLRLAWSSFNVELEPYHYDTFVSTTPGRLHEETATFSLGADGKVSELRFVERTFKRK
jgi:CubicO group peptidase (beta-lactamase class C family)